MNRRMPFWIVGLVTMVLCASNVLAIGRVAKRWYVFDMYGGHSKPVGSYDYISFIDFGTELDADQVYDNSFHLGFSLGRMVANRFVSTIGFAYTKIEPLDRYYINSTEYWEFDPFTPKFSQYDISLSVAYHFLPIEQTGFTPFIGGSMKGGLTRQYLRGYESEYEANGALALLFGAEVKVWEGKNQSMLTLMSTNSYDFAASGYRPKYLNLGVGLRWYLRP